VTKRDTGPVSKGADREITRQFNGIAVPLAGTYHLDQAHTFITFAAQHMVVGRVRGRFASFSGTIIVAEDPTQSSVDVVIRTESVDTQNDTRDEDLRSAHFLDVESFPLMTYRGSGVVPDLDGRWTVSGDLTVRDVTRAVPLNSVFLGGVVDPFGNPRFAFAASASINRRDYELMWDLDRETGGLLVGKDVVLDISAEAILQA
jgi:polyisoprenoid-binding protein YceI